MRNLNRVILLTIGINTLKSFVDFTHTTQKDRVPKLY